MRPETCDECLWSGHERCPFYKPLILRCGPVPDDCSEALLRITSDDIARVILDEDGRARLRTQAEQYGMFHPAFILAMLNRIEELELEVRLLENECVEEGER